MKNVEKFKKQFIEKTIAKFGNKFSYNKVMYVDCKTPVIITCKEHGDFTILPKSLSKSEWGCPICTKEHIVRKKKILIDGKDRKEMREYRIWKAMRTRVNNNNINCSDHYSGRGINLDPSWNDFETFYKDMGPCPEGYSIDRIDNNGNYCKENCRLASAEIQSKNRGDFNEVYTYNGETHVLKEWAKIFDIKYTTLYMRIHRSGKTFEEAIQQDPFNKLIEYNGEKHTLSEWCKLKNMEYNVVINRIAKHKWSFKDAINTPKGQRRKNQDIV